MPTDAKTRKSKLADTLRRQILTLELAPGADLDEAGLSEAHGLSRTPLREVLRDLAGEGYVNLTDGRGARVSDMSHANLRAFFQAAPMIYGAVSRLAAQNARAGDVTRLRALQDRFRATLTTGSPADRALSNNAFHAAIGDIAANPYLTPALNRLLIDHARISMTFYRPTTDRMAANTAKASDQHDAFIAAIASGDEETTVQLAADHWALSRDQIEMFVMPGALEMPLGQVS